MNGWYVMVKWKEKLYYGGVYNKNWVDFNRLEIEGNYPITRKKTEQTKILFTGCPDKVSDSLKWLCLYDFVTDIPL